MVFKLGGSSKDAKGNIKVDSEKADTQTADSAEFTTSRFYGVRSYLHQFYASPTTEEPDGGWYLLPPAKPNRTVFYLCRFLFLTGFVILCAGLVLFGVGCFGPRPTFDQALQEIPNDEDVNGDVYMTRENMIRFFQYLHDDRFYACRTIALCIMPSGALLILLSLFLPICLTHCRSSKQAGWSELDSPHASGEPPVRVYSDRDPSKPKSKTIVSPGDKVPCDVTRVSPISQTQEHKGKGGADSVLMDEGEKPILH